MTTDSPDARGWRARLAGTLAAAAGVALVAAGVDRPVPVGAAAGLLLAAWLVRPRPAADRDRAAADAAPVFLWAARPDGRFTFLNRTWEEFTGRPADPDPTAAWADAVHPDERDRWRERFGVGRTDRRPFRGDFRVRRADGEYRWVRVDGRPVFDPGGRFREFVGSGVDVTDSRRAEEAIQASEARQRAIIDNAIDCIVTADKDGKVIDFNPAAVDTFGHPRDAAIGRPLAELLVPARDRAAPPPGRLIGADTPTVFRQRLEMTAVRADGTEFPAELAFMRNGPDGGSTVTAFIRDVTDVKEADDRKREAAAALRAAKDEAEAASRAKSRFLANMSHEVRTPMAAVVGYAEMLLDPGLRPDEQLAAVQAIRRNGKHLLQIISDVLDLSKIEAGRMDLERLPSRPGRLVAEAVGAAAVRGQGRGVRVVAAADGRLPVRVTTDPTRVRQILDNLLSNAVKFSPPGGEVRVRVRLADGSPRLVVAVEDDGIGMTADEQGRLFRPFTQADPSTTRRYGGTGLGLSICRRLAEALGGSIRVTSNIGMGSRFTVELPVAADDLAETEEHVDLSRVGDGADRAEGGRRLGGRVLVVDDSPDNRRIVRYFLERAGVAVEEAANGREAVGRAFGGGYGLVLMDMQMPEMDGYAATAALRRAGFGGAVVALTAHAMAGDEDRCLEAGCTAYLSKPVDVDALLTTAAAFLPAGDGEPGGPADNGVPADLLADFTRGLPDRVGELTAAVRAGDAGRVGAAAHALRGSAGMFRFAAVAETAGLIEDACREAEWVDLVAELVAELDGLVGEVVARPGPPE